jgi:hypothetical protein
MPALDTLNFKEKLGMWAEFAVNVDCDSSPTINSSLVQDFAIYKLSSTGADTATLAAPTKSGLFVALNMVVDGGDIVVTVTGTYDGSNSTITFNDISDWVLLYSVDIGSTTFRWRVVAGGGTNASLLTLPLINGGLTASGAVANDFSGSTGTFLTSTGANTLSGPVNTTIGGSTAAAGSTYSDAGALPAATGQVYPTTAADNTKGVIIHANDKVTGRLLLIGNGVSTTVLKVYGPSGATINGAGANAAFSSTAGKGVIAVCLSSSGNTWLMW